MSATRWQCGGCGQFVESHNHICYAAGPDAFRRARDQEALRLQCIALHKFIDRAFTVAQEIAVPRRTCTLDRFMVLLEREARVRRIVHERIERAFNDAGGEGTAATLRDRA